MDKNVYTIEEVDELKAWAEQAEFPAEMQLDKAVYIPDVKETVHRLIMQAYVCHENPRLQGCLRLLERIKAGVEEEKKKLDAAKNAGFLSYLQKKIRNLHSNNKD